MNPFDTTENIVLNAVYQYLNNVDHMEFIIKNLFFNL